MVPFLKNMFTDSAPHYTNLTPEKGGMLKRKVEEKTYFNPCYVCYRHQMMRSQTVSLLYFLLSPSLSCTDEDDRHHFHSCLVVLLHFTLPHFFSTVLLLNRTERNSSCVTTNQFFSFGFQSHMYNFRSSCTSIVQS